MAGSVRFSPTWAEIEALPAWIVKARAPCDLLTHRLGHGFSAYAITVFTDGTDRAVRGSRGLTNEGPPP